MSVSQVGFPCPWPLNSSTLTCIKNQSTRRSPNRCWRSHPRYPFPQSSSVCLQQLCSGGRHWRCHSWIDRRCWPTTVDGCIAAYHPPTSCATGLRRAVAHCRASAIFISCTARTVRHYRCSTFPSRKRAVEEDWRARCRCQPISASAIVRSFPALAASVFCSLSLSLFLYFTLFP